jgi:hypothetical protein
MQRRHDDFERRALREARMRVHRNAAAVVRDGEESVFLVGDVDPGRMSGDGLVHGVVDDFGEEVMQRLFIGAADIHAGPAADRLEALEDLDVGGRVGLLGRRAGGVAARRLAPGRAALRGPRGMRILETREQVLDLRHEVQPCFRVEPNENKT